MEVARSRLSELGYLYDSYYKSDKSALLSTKAEELLKILNEVESSSDLEASSTQLQSQLAYLRGTCYYFASGADDGRQFATQAEVLLSRAVKLDPSNANAWVALGGCLCKKDKKEDAYSCFSEAVKQAASPSGNTKNKVAAKEALRDLSIITRQLPSPTSSAIVQNIPNAHSSSVQEISSPEKSVVNSASSKTVSGGVEVMTTIDESIQLAKKAIELDLQDHKSWYVLGNAHTHRYFASPLQDMADLTKALSSYRKAESLPGGTENPDLYYNRGNVQRYMQLYDDAVVSYRRAVELDESFVETITAVKHILAFQALVVDKTKDASNKLASAIKVAKDELSQTSFLKCVGIKDLQLGQNTKWFGCKILNALSIDSASCGGTPICFLCADKDGSVVVLAIYNVGEDAPSLFRDQIVSVSEPYVRLLSTNQPDSVKIVMVLSIAHLKITGNTSLQKSFAKPTIVSENR